MPQVTCESNDLVMFLGGDTDELDSALCSREADLRVEAHNGSSCDEKSFCICQECAHRLLWLSHHPVGWIENCKQLHTNRSSRIPRPATV